MNLSDERLGALATAIAKTLQAEGMIAASDPQLAYLTVRKAMAKYLQTESAIDAKVRQKIESLKRGVAQGGREWDILYQQYYDAELKKHV
ncbi:MAG: DUF507 family protein [Deltaproteobacteria bacterium]|nr:DUF507 family protein [Deltaproteobacteria bacterium]